MSEVKADNDTEILAEIHNISLILGSIQKMIQNKAKAAAIVRTETLTDRTAKLYMALRRKG